MESHGNRSNRAISSVRNELTADAKFMRRGLSALGFCMVLASSAFAQVEPPGVSQESYVNGFSTLEDGAAPVSIATTGERIDLYTGALSFSVTDVDLPGTGDLRVAVTRTLTAGKAEESAGFTQHTFADWRLEVPRITGVVSGTKKDGQYGWQTGDVGHEFDRCSHFGIPPMIETENTEFQGYEYSRGFSLHIPGEGTQLLLRRSSENGHVPTMQVGGQTVEFPIVTNRDWVATCLPTLVNGEPGEGFLVVAPDGRKFWFNLLTYRIMDDLKKRIDNFANPLAPQWETLELRKAVLSATRVEDRHGNWVEYGAASAPSGTYRIQASDGREIDIVSDSDSTTVTAQPQSGAPRVWIYDKTLVTLPDTTQDWTLSKVTLPDDSTWSYDLDALSMARIELAGNGCNLFPVPSNHAVGDSIGALSVTTPSGLHVAYDVRLAERGHSDTPTGCTQAPSPSYSVSMVTANYYLWAMESRTVTGPGLPQRQWFYDYSDPHASWETDCNPSCVDEVWTEVSDPEGHVTRYTFSNRFDASEGNLLKTEWGRGEGAGGSALRSEQSIYATAAAGPWPTQYGLNLFYRSNWKKRASRTPLQSRVIDEGGSTYDYSVQSFDGYARPTIITRAATGQGGDSISETLAYTDKPAFWVLGTLTSRAVTAPAEHVGDVPFSQTLYANGQPHAVSRFGRTVATYEWYPSGHAAAGELKKVTDGRSHATEYSDYQRGVPKTIDHADSTDISLTVNDFGEVLSVTDEELDTVTVVRDDMGRITRRIFPADAGHDWNDFVIDYEIVPSIEYGVGIGHFRVTRSNGSHHLITIYDAALNPVLTKETDGSGQPDAGDGHMVWRQFDSAGRETFRSYPMDYAASLPGNRPGILTDYDALGRVTDTYADWEGSGTLHTATRYLSGNRVSVTNPRNHVTTTTYQAFDTPSYEDPTKVVFADVGNTDVTIVRDVYGKPETMTQSGQYPGYSVRSVSHSFAYDAYQQLCLQVSPETGRTGYGYYANGLLEWSVQSLPAQSDPCSASFTPPAATTVYRSYDARDRLTDIMYPGTTPDTSFDYDDDGKLDTASRGASSWNLEWLNRGLLDKETLTISGAPGSPYTIDYAYNARGQRDSLTYPSGRQITLDPDAMGRPRQLGVYASGIDYDAWGAPEAISYGNGMAFAQSRNTRGLIETTSYSLGGYSLVDRTLSYDKNGNLETITGAKLGFPGDTIFRNGFEFPAAFQRSFGYDAIDRLTSASSSQYGSETFDYDPLGNLRQSTRNGAATSIAYEAATNRIASVDGTDYDHDTRGNVTAIGSFTLTWNRANELVSDGNGTAFAHDARGWRYRKDADIPDSGYFHDFHFVYDHAGRLIERIDNGTVTDFVYLGSTPVARIEANETTYLHPDYQNTPILETSETGSATRSPVYLAYGFTAPGEGYKGLDRVPGYTGSYPELETGLNYMGARYQYGTIGRFLSPDPAPLNPLHPAGLNRYAYAASNPIRYVDPSGLAPEDEKQSPDKSSCDEMCQIMEEYRRTNRPWTENWEAVGEGAQTAGEIVEVVYETALPVPVAKLSLFGRIGKFIKGIFGRPSVDDVLKRLSKGRSSAVKTVGSDRELNEVYGTLSRGGTPVDVPGYSGTWVERSDGVRVGIRDASKSGGRTIDIRYPDGRTRRVHVK